MARFGAPAHAVEDEEFWLWSEEGGVAQAGRFQVGFGALGDGAGIALVSLAVSGLDHVAGHDQRRFFKERINVGRAGVRDQLHVRGFNALPARDGRTVKSVAVGEFALIKMGNRHRGVVLLAPGVGKAKVNELDFVFLDHFHDVCDGFCHQNLLLLGWWLKNSQGCKTHFLCHSPEWVNFLGKPLIVPRLCRPPAGCLHFSAHENSEKKWLLRATHLVR